MPKKIAKVSPLAMAIVVIDTGHTYIHGDDNDRWSYRPAIASGGREARVLIP